MGLKPGQTGLKPGQMIYKTSDQVLLQPDLQSVFSKQNWNKDKLINISALVGHLLEKVYHTSYCVYVGKDLEPLRKINHTFNKAHPAPLSFSMFWLSM